MKLIIIWTLFFPKFQILNGFYDYFLRNPSDITNSTNYPQAGGSDIGYHIHDCTFNTLSNNRGVDKLVFVSGAIFFRTTRYVNLLVESCMFYACRSSGVHFICPANGACVIYKNCASHCHTDEIDTNEGQFCYIQTRSDRMNVIDLVSVTKCSPSLTQSRNSAIYLESGRQIVNQYNASYNEVNMRAGIYHLNTNSLNVTFCTYADNNPHHSVVIWLEGGIGWKNISFTNIIRNNSPQGNGIIYFHHTDSTPYFLINCIIQWNLNQLFYRVNGNILMLSGWLQHGNTLSNGYLTTSLVTSTGVATALRVISHFQSYYCGPLYFQQEIISIPCRTMVTLPATPTECIISTIGSESIIFSFTKIIYFNLLYFLI